MTRRLLFLIVLSLVFGNYFLTQRSAAQTAITPICAGTNDTARFTTAIASLVASGGGTLKVPRKTTGTMCAVNTLTFPAEVTVDQTEGRIKVNNGHLLTYTVMPIAGNRQVFYNVGPGLGSVSLPAGKVQAAWFGGNVGAQIQLADTALGANAGEIEAWNGGAITASVTVSANHSVYTHRGNYPMTLPVGGTIDTFMIILKDGAEWKGDGDSTNIIEPVGSVRVFATYGMTVNGHTLPGTDVTSHIVIRNLRISGNPNQVPGTIATGARSVIGLGNVHDARIENVTIDGASDLGLTVGSTASPTLQVATGCSIASGTAILTCPTAVFTNAQANNQDGIGVSGAGAAGMELQTYIKTYTSATQVTLGTNASTTKTANAIVYLSQRAEDVWVERCKFKNFTSQVLSVVNGRRVHFKDNTFVDAGKYNVTSGCPVDLEPNTPDGVIQGIEITGNIFDNRGSIDQTGAPYLSAGGVCVQNSADTRNFGPVTVADNHFTGGPLDRPESPRLSFGVFTLKATNTTISDNWCITTSQPCVILTGSSDYNTVYRNHAVNSGGGGLSSYEIRDSHHNEITYNEARWDSSGPAYNADSMVETGSADYNSYKGNATRGIPVFAAGANSHSRLLDWEDRISAIPADFSTLNRAVPIENFPADGTLLNKLVKLSGAPSKALLPTAGDQDLVGILLANPGTTGFAWIATDGDVPCIFDNATTAGNYVTHTTNATYSTGTVATNVASSTITGTGTTWTSSMTGGKFCIGAYCEKVNYASATTLVIASGGGWAGGTASGQAYTLNFGGMCHDAGAAYPTGQVIGRVLETNASNGMNKVHLTLAQLPMTPTFSGQITSTLAPGTAPLVVASSSKVLNLNVDSLDNFDWASPAGIGTVGANTGRFTQLLSISGISAFSKGADVASAATITATGNLFHVTGTTTITSVSGTSIAAGTRITIIFDGVLTFTDGSNLKLAGDFVTTADDSITLVYDGTNWYEVARAVN